MRFCYYRINAKQRTFNRVVFLRVRPIICMQCWRCPVAACDDFKRVAAWPSGLRTRSIFFIRVHHHFCEFESSENLSRSFEFRKKRDYEKKKNKLKENEREKKGVEHVQMKINSSFLNNIFEFKFSAQNIYELEFSAQTFFEFGKKIEFKFEFAALLVM